MVNFQTGFSRNIFNSLWQGEQRIKEQTDIENLGEISDKYDYLEREKNELN
jgi:hypothetical protein